MVDVDDDALFVKDGVPVKFCFHRSVTQGRNRIVRDVERHGGQIVADERVANVLLVDEQEDLTFIRLWYYSSMERYRLSIYVEPRGFVAACIRAGSYRHIPPARQGMPGRVPGGGGRARVPFSEEDRDHLAYYLATQFPKRDGRMGVKAYRNLERLGREGGRGWAWAQRHTFWSWREHYKMNPDRMDERINAYLDRLANIGHHFGHDPRSHDHRNLRRAEEEEEEEEEEEGEEQDWRRGVEREGERVRPSPVPPRQPERGARREQEVVQFSDEEEDDTVVVPPPAKRHRLHADGHRHSAQETRARVNERPEAERDENGTAHKKDVDMEDNQDFEGSDLFGDREYEEQLRSDYDNQEAEFPRPFSPRASPVPGPNVPPLSTQATLIASPLRAEKQPARPMRTAAALAPTAPPSSQRTLVMTQERVRGALAEPGPSAPRERQSVRGAPTPPPQASQLHETWVIEIESEVEDDIKEEDHVQMEDVPTSVWAGEEQSEEVVDKLLESANGDPEEVEAEVEADDGDGHSVSVDGMSVEGGAPSPEPFQDVEAPSDSDDAETHGSLIRAAAKGEHEKGDSEGEFGSSSEQEQEQDEVDVEEEEKDQVEEMAGRLRATRVVSPPRPRITRSQTRAQAEIQTRSGNVRTFPSPGTRARAVVDRVREEEQTRPYVPPAGSRAAKAVGRRR